MVPTGVIRSSGSERLGYRPFSESRPSIDPEAQPQRPFLAGRCDLYRRVDPRFRALVKIPFTNRAPPQVATGREASGSPEARAWAGCWIQVEAALFRPCKGRWRAQRDGGASSVTREPLKRGYPSTTRFASVPLPLQGRNQAAARPAFSSTSGARVASASRQPRQRELAPPARRRPGQPQERPPERPRARGDEAERQPAARGGPLGDRAAGEP